MTEDQIRAHAMGIRLDEPLLQPGPQMQHKIARRCFQQGAGERREELLTELYLAYTAAANWCAEAQRDCARARFWERHHESARKALLFTVALMAVETGALIFGWLRP